MAPRLLHVLHSWETPGGTELLAKHLIDALSRRYQSSVIYPRNAWQQTPALHPVSSGRSVVWRLERPVWASPLNVMGFPTTWEDPAVEAKFDELLRMEKIELVHFHHFSGWGTLRLAEIARAHHLPVVLGLTDFFLLCPDWTLRGPDGLPCGKRHSADGSDLCGDCFASKTTSLGPTPVNAAWSTSYLQERLARARALVDQADRLVTLSHFLAERLSDGLGHPLSDFQVIAPSLGQNFQPLEAPSVEGPLHIAFLGCFVPQKGSRFFLSLAKALHGKGYRFSVVGACPNEDPLTFSKLGIESRGRYEPDRLPASLRDVDVVLVPSQWEETYGMVVTEAQACGVPVVASDLGAISERIVDGVNGFTRPAYDLEAWVSLLESLGSDRKKLLFVREELKRNPVCLQSEGRHFVQAHAAIYDECLDSKSRLAIPEPFLQRPLNVAVPTGQSLKQ